MEQGSITISLDHDEALVLFEWLARSSDAETVVVEDSSEQRVLWCLQGQLERVLIEPLKADYSALVDAAPKRVRAE